MIFSVRSVQKCKRDKLGAAVSQPAKRRLGGWCEMAVNLRVSQLEQLVSCGILASL
jgi:hypothetical protein